MKAHRIILCLIAGSLCFFSCIRATITPPASGAHPRTFASNTSELKSALTKSLAGDTIWLAGTEFSEPCTLKADAGNQTLVHLRAEVGSPARITALWRIEGRGLSLENVLFTGEAKLDLAGDGLRVESCNFNHILTPQWMMIRPEARACVVQNCTFENKSNNPELEVYSQLMVITVNNTDENHRIVGNTFRNVSKGKMGNGYECIQLITKGNPFDPGPGDAGVLIAANTFADCNGEAEVISVKANGNTIRENSFLRCRGSVVLRHGHRNRVESNLFSGSGIPATGGVRMQGRDQQVLNNQFQELALPAIVIMQGTADSLYMPVENARVVGNQILNCRGSLEVDLLHSAYSSGVAARHVLMKDNLFIGSHQQEFLRHRQDSASDWEWQGNLGNKAFHEGVALDQSLRAEKTGDSFRVQTELNRGLPAAATLKAGAPAKPYINELYLKGIEKQAK
jgi:poly(beta-D-mannuronate) lyase